MEAKRYIGIDLHRNCFTACLRLENGREYLKTWKLEQLERFASKLRRTVRRQLDHPADDNYTSRKNRS
jgi:hypothetical protein